MDLARDHVSPPPAPTRVVIVGVGLLGGSLLAALQPQRARHGGSLHLTAVTSAGTHDALATRDWCDDIADHPGLAGACTGADIVLLCTSLLTIREQIDTIASMRHALAPCAIVSDVGSTKADICTHGFAAFPADGAQAARFVGGHPMAGSERSGLTAADPLLYQSALWVLCPPEDLDETRLATLRSIINWVGARTATLDPATHDAAVARISHVPQLVSSALAGWAGSNEQLAATALTLAAGGFRDMTRLAVSSFAVWADIVATNRTPIADGLQELSAHLGTLAAAVRDPHDSGQHPHSLEHAFSRGRGFREQFHMPRKGILRDLAEFVVRLDDRPGQLLALFTPLAEAGINVQDLEILKVREGESGTVLMGFASATIADQARELLTRAGFTIHDR